MKVKELIEILQKLDQEKEVCYIDTDDGRTDIDYVDDTDCFNDPVDYYILR